MVGAGLLMIFISLFALFIDLKRPLWEVSMVY